MLLDIGDKKYAVHFAHRCNWHMDTVNGEHTAEWAAYCGIHEGACTEKGCAMNPQPYQGAAYCNPCDQFSKKAGRKISLGRALKPLPRSLRQQIWEAYFKECPRR